MRHLPRACSNAIVMAVMAHALTGCSKPQPRPAEPARPIAVAEALPVEAASATPQPSPPPADRMPPEAAKTVQADKADKTDNKTDKRDKAAPSAGASPAVAEARDANAATSLESLRKTLTTTNDSKVRVDTIDAIANLGQNAHPAIDDLVKATADTEPRVRWRAARGLGMIGEHSLRVLPDLVNLLADPDPVVATQAAAAITLVRKDDGRAAAAVPADDVAKYAAATDALSKAALHPDARVRRASLRALRVLSPNPQALARLVSRQLADADPSVVMPAIHTLADMDGTAVPFLLESLKDPKARYWATVALTEIGAEAAPATPLLIEEVQTGETEEKLQAILALAAIGSEADAAAPELVKALESNDNSLRFAAAFALGKLRAVSADEPLKAAAAGDDAFLASIASWARAQIHADDAALRTEAVARLREGLKSEAPSVRAASTSAISDLAEKLDSTAQQALAPDFVSLLTDPDPEVGTAAGAALIRLGVAAVDCLRARLADQAVRLNVIEILSAMGPAAAPATEDLVKMMDDTDPQCRGDAAMAIAAIGPAAAVAVPKLQTLLTPAALAADTAPDVAAPGVQYAAAFALGKLGTAASPALGRLRELAAAKDPLLATVATWASLKIAPQDASLFESAVPLLRQALRGDVELARMEAAIALGDIGSPASGAIPILELVAEDDPSRSVRDAAAEALVKIRGR